MDIHVVKLYIEKSEAIINGGSEMVFPLVESMQMVEELLHRYRVVESFGLLVWLSFMGSYMLILSLCFIIYVTVVYILYFLNILR